MYFSDAHALKQIGRNRDGNERLTRIKMNAPSFEGVVRALQDPEARIRLEDMLPRSYPRILGARLVGGFLDGQEIPFSPNLTCLIGGRGTGKSTALEAVRCACTSTAHEREKGDATGWPDAVQLVYQDQFGQQHYLERAARGDTLSLSGSDSSRMSVPIEGYAQDRVAEIIRGYQDDPGLLTEFLDPFADLDEVQARLRELKEQLASNADLIRPLTDASTRKLVASRQLEDAKTKLKAVEASNLKEALRYRRLLTLEVTLRDALDQRLAEIKQDISGLKTKVDAASLVSGAGIEDLSEMPSKDYIVGKGEDDPGVLDLVGALDLALAAWRKEGQDELDKLLESIRAKRGDWVEYERRIEERIQKIVSGLRAQGVNPNLTALNQLAEQEAKSKAAIQAANKDQAELLKSRKQRKKLLDEYRQQQARRYHLRDQATKALTEALNSSLTEFKVKIRFREAHQVDEYQAWMREVLGLKAFRGDRMADFCRAIHPIDLATALRSRSAAKLTMAKDGSGNNYFAKDSDASEFIGLFGGADLEELEAIAVTDSPEISLTTLVDGDARVVPFDNLSHGQKASILLGALLFSADDTPLIIDQPEDHLDSAFIFETVVATLRSRKERRQVILATHNANIAVLGDAEMIVPLQGYKGRGVVRDQGSVDSEETSKRACKILEGGNAAYLRRGEMYGFEITAPNGG